MKNLSLNDVSETLCLLCGLQKLIQKDYCHVSGNVQAIEKAINKSIAKYSAMENKMLGIE